MIDKHEYKNIEDLKQGREAFVWACMCIENKYNCFKNFTNKRRYFLDMAVSNNLKRFSVSLPKPIYAVMERIVEEAKEKGLYITKSELITDALINYFEMAKKSQENKEEEK